MTTDRFTHGSSLTDRHMVVDFHVREIDKAPFSETFFSAAINLQVIL
jgi:hypothetical protein